ncbi:MAG: MarR family transcriptional regulator [Asticcacaulis sp.]
MDFDDSIIRAHMQSFGYLLYHCHALYQKQLLKTVEGTGIHMGHVVVLASLWQHRRQDRDSDLTRPGWSRCRASRNRRWVLFLDALEKDGWVERRRHPTDRRAYLIHLTDSGRERFDKLAYGSTRASRRH